MSIKQIAYRILTWLTGRLGFKIREHETGELVGRAILIPWNGKIHLIGYTGTRFVFPTFAPREEKNYSHHQIVFRVHPRPDFRHESERS